MDIETYLRKKIPPNNAFNTASRIARARYDELYLLSYMPLEVYSPDDADVPALYKDMLTTFQKAGVKHKPALVIIEDDLWDEYNKKRGVSPNAMHYVQDINAIFCPQALYGRLTRIDASQKDLYIKNHEMGHVVDVDQRGHHAKISRRHFLKGASAVGVATGLGGYAGYKTDGNGGGVLGGLLGAGSSETARRSIKPIADAINTRKQELFADRWAKKKMGEEAFFQGLIGEIEGTFERVPMAKPYIRLETLDKLAPKSRYGDSERDEIFAKHMEQQRDAIRERYAGAPLNANQIDILIYVQLYHELQMDKLSRSARTIYFFDPTLAHNKGYPTDYARLSDALKQYEQQTSQRSQH